MIGIRGGGVILQKRGERGLPSVSCYEITVKVRNGVRRQDIQRIRHRLDITCQVKDVF